MPCVRYIAHGKGRLCRSLVAVCALPCAAHGKAFAVGFWGFTVCPWHTARGGGVSRSECLRHRECKLNINNSDRMAGWRAVSRNPMSLHHLAIGRGGASWIALEPVRNKLIQAIFFRTKVSPVLFHHGDKMHRFKAFKYSKRARSVQVNKIHTISPTLRLMRGAPPELHELSSGA